MKMTQIAVKRKGTIVNVLKTKDEGYKVTVMVKPHSFDSYIDFKTKPTIDGKEINKGEIVSAGQIIRG